MAEEHTNNSSTENLVKSSSSLKDQPRDDVAVPIDFLCPLSGAIMIFPVLLSNGQICERSEIEEWLNSAKKICPVTKEALENTDFTPEDDKRKKIRDWCMRNNKSDLIHYTFQTPEHIRKEYFGSLHEKLSSGNIEIQKEAAKEVRKETTNCPYFRKIYAQSPVSVAKLIAPLCVYPRTPILDPELEDDLIATLAIISGYENLKEEIAGSLSGILVLVEALQSKNIETQRNGAIAIQKVSTVNSICEFIGSTDAIIKLAVLLVGNNRNQICNDITKTLLGLLSNKRNKLKAVKQLVEKRFIDNGQFEHEEIFQKIEDGEFIDTLLPLFVSLSKIREGIEQIEKYDCKLLLTLLRVRAKNRESGTALILSALQMDGSKWKQMIMEEENVYGTITDISHNGSLFTKKKAEEILSILRLEASMEQDMDWE